MISLIRVNQTNKTKRKQTDTENKWVIAKREGNKRLGEIGEGDYVKTFSYIMNKSQWYKT